MIGRAENSGSLGEEMQGSRKNRSTLDVLFKKTLTFDIARQEQSNLALQAAMIEYLQIWLCFVPGGLGYPRRLYWLTQRL